MHINVIIHCGPPKTGSSSIQKWLNTNAQKLLVKGIYYPAHEMDENGISSGNHTSVFEFKDNKWLLSDVKIDALKKQAEELKAHTILLSSEFFFRRLELLAKPFPDLELIGYIRCPLEVIESSYNQSVKRNFNCNKIKIPKRLAAENLATFSKFFKKHPKVRSHLRPFDETLFFKQDLIADFLNTINCVDIYDSNTIKINPSYCFESLEFMRWLNQFELAEYHHVIDLWLQNLKSDLNEFSLIPAEQYHNLLNQYADKVQTFCDQWNVEQHQAFIKNLRAKRPKPYCEQVLPVKMFKDMLSKLLTEKLELVVIFENILATPDKENYLRPEFFKVMRWTVKRKLMILRLKHFVKRRLNK